MTGGTRVRKSGGRAPYVRGGVVPGGPIGALLTAQRRSDGMLCAWLMDISFHLSEINKVSYFHLITTAQPQQR